MRKNKWIVVAVLGAFTLCLPLHMASAGKLDAYRNMLAQRSCTISYENITPAEREHNRDSSNMTSSFGQMYIPPMYTHKGYKGMVVMQGEDRYVETNYGDYSKCQLKKGGEVYEFKREVKKGKESWKALNGKSTVTASEFQPEKELLYGESFGTRDVSRLFGVILPKDRIPAGQPIYDYVGGGNLPGGQSYEDYRASSAAGLEAVRYYFDGSKLVRIAAASYSRNGDGQLVGRKCILKIMDFSNTPDNSKLNLPADLKAKSLKSKE
ncbi:hypothetical protein [Selenomonas ruminantium]|uniref:Uncharacterized protein n=1 Tax=Selenomonas ruminantium TaxID=971 RepID=A0A1K1Q583_SELRU|nr:hypothetical protein [Selenomonas ruminantium]SFW54843.1 hypothetical protein SAMN02910323_2368 [Selenomonas ruminantium]